MGWDCTIALMKCTRQFKDSAVSIESAIESMYPGGITSSCNLTMSLMGLMICPGQAITNVGVKNNKAQFVPAKAVDEMTRLLETDNAIFVSISPDHHFTVLPLDESNIGLLQGFEETYTLHEWIARSGKVKMDKATFLDNFAKLFSSSPAVACAAAVALFAIPGEEEDIEEYYGAGGIFIASLATAAVNLFSEGSKAALGAVG